jgi:hypothetical protein
MQEGRQALDCAGISQAYRDFTIYSALNFMTGLKKQCKIAAKWVLPPIHQKNARFDKIPHPQSW